MSGVGLDVPVTITTKIAKYAEGAVPGVDDPYDIVESTIILTGTDASNYLASLAQQKEE